MPGNQSSCFMVLIRKHLNFMTLGEDYLQNKICFFVWKTTLDFPCEASSCQEKDFAVLPSS